MKNQITVWGYIEKKMESLKGEGRKVTAENYGKAERCLWRYCHDESLSFEGITEEFVAGFNSYLEGTKIQKATVSFYNRVLRSIYNQAARDGLVKNRHPFDGAYTKVECRLSPVSGTVRTEGGEVVTIDKLSKEEIMRQYQSLRRRYNTLVGRISSLVGV